MEEIQVGQQGAWLIFVVVSGSEVSLRPGAEGIIHTCEYFVQRLVILAIY